MLGEGGKALSKLREAVREFHACEDRGADLKGLRRIIDELKVELASVEGDSVVFARRQADSNQKGQS